MVEPQVVPREIRSGWSFQRRLLHALLPVIMVLLFTIVLFPPACAGTETLITINTTGSSQYDPAIHGDWIVWTDTRTGTAQIVAYNVVSGVETRISPPGSPASQPDIFADGVVWRDGRNGNYDIYLYNLTTASETAIILDSDNQEHPGISGNLIVWQDDRNGSPDVYLYDLATSLETLLTPDTPGSNQEYPAISGTKIVWQDNRHYYDDTYYVDNWLEDYYYDILMKDIATGELTNVSHDLSDPGLDETRPVISGDIVVWSDERWSGPYDIYMNDTTTGDLYMVAENNADEKILPAIDGTTIIWLNERVGTGYSDIYLKDVSTLPPAGSDTRITTEESIIVDSGKGPKISGNRIVWTDYRNDNMDVYMHTLGADETCPVANFSMSAQSGPSPLTVEFMDTSIPGTTAIGHRFWEFGDGNSTTDELNPGWTYNVPGTYTARLTINNPLCRNMTPPTARYIVTTGASPVAAFTPSATSGMVPLTVDFTDASVGATAWNWSFGDGAYSDLQDPSHTYAEGGTFHVVLNASNAFGYSFADAEIEGLTGADVSSDTTITGIIVDGRFGGQFLVFDGTTLAGYATPAPDVLVSPPLAGDGWQNITFITEDPAGFHDFGNDTLMGNISSVILQTIEIEPAGFKKSTGALSSVNYSVTLDTWPENAVLRTQLWEGYTTAALAVFRTIASRSGYTYLWDVVYTTKISKTNFPASGTARLFMSVNSSWADRYVDRDHTFAARLSDDRTTGEVIAARHLYSDPVRDLDYFIIDSPRGLSTFGLSQLSGSGNPLQLITLTVTSHVDPFSLLGPGYIPSGSADSETGNSGGKSSSGPPSSADEQAGPGAGETGVVYTNPEGVVTRASTLHSADNAATLTIPEGVLALDVGGNPLGSVTITASPGSGTGETGSTAFVFEGMAFELGPDGATFDPAISLSFTVPQAPGGREFVVRSFDSGTGTWQDLPTTFDPATGQVTAQVTHFCCFGLFSRITPNGTPRSAEPVISGIPVSAATPPPPSTAISIFTSMMLWVWDLVLTYAVIILLIGVAGSALVLYYWHSRGPF
jgi:beta propeller repeat protein